ncbi:MAG: phenylalanine--tRNA ligase subunit alpha [Clostridia bacterium]|nr:phenylalanine--tRNA ligase subunit alpha [Clostridia bacterium]
MEEKLKLIWENFEKRVSDIQNVKDLNDLKSDILGKKSELNALLKAIGQASKEDRPKFGQMINEQRQKIQKKIADVQNELETRALNKKLKEETIDITLPGHKVNLGHSHVLSQTLSDVENIFISMGFQVVNGPEIETDYYNFEALNIPKDHPARDTQDTFYINDNLLLRTQTSPMQIHVMENQKPPIRIIAPGRVYRSDTVDATHSPIFHQVEGLVIDKNITMGNLKWTLQEFAKKLYGENTKIRLRPHHFQFTEPSCEIDVTCFKCQGKGCPMCKDEGFIEILGAGMVHPNVLRNCNIDPEVYSGFAFGLGLERLAMFKFNIDDMRLFYKNDTRFLSQF